jgi:hypothetical protein
MNLSPDPRQLKTQITLSIMNAPESGFFSGEYTASTATKSQDNLNVLNNDFESSYTYENGETEPKYSRRLRVLSSLQNARIPEINTAISASSCTFAFGAIAPGEKDPVLNLLKGPTKAEGYSPVFVDDLTQGTVQSQTDDYIDKSQHTPKIPFINTGNVLTTYNIWNIDKGDNKAYKYIGPAVSGKNTGTLRTIKTPGAGAQVEVSSQNTNTVIKRIFPTAYDAIYQNGAQIYNPDGSPPENILARGNNGNNGFHINFSASNMQTTESAIKIFVQPQVPNTDFINNFYIEFKIDSKPVLSIFDPYTKKYIVQTDLIAPILDKNNMNSYDVYVHFSGPNLLIGFSPDITRWNTIINFSGREVFCPPETDVYISLSNTNLKFRYSAIIFNNFNNNQPAGSRRNYIIAEIRYSKKKITNISNFLNAIKNSFENASYRINKFPQNTGYNSTNPIDKNISYFADLRLLGQQFEPITQYTSPAYKSADPDKQTLLFKLIYNTTIEGPAFMQIEVPHAGVLTEQGAANLGVGGAGSYTFVNPSLNQLFYNIGDITAWVETWSVQCNAALSNLSKIGKTASITLKNLDSTQEGQRFINAIENNLLTITIEAGYNKVDLQPFFQGFIVNTTYQRKGNDSTFTVYCQDIASFVLENIYFDKNMMIAGMRHDLAIDSIMACSGFWSYYFRNNHDNNGGIISGIDLRLNSNSTNNQDLIKLNPLDKIYDKLGKLLERLNNPYSLPTFRWAEKYGFKLECRNNYTDDDLKFTGLTANGHAYSFDSNSSNYTNFLQNYQKDLHGLLVDEYKITTDVKNLAAGVRVFGVAMTGFLADERYSPTSVSVDKLPIGSQLDRLTYLAGAPFDTAQAPYIGFKKYLMWSMQRNEIPDQQVLKRITDSIELVSRTPISSISFSCYVTKPLNFHGKFKINVFLGSQTNSTDYYVYQTVDYRYDKNNNLIIATVQGTNMPISLGG